MSIYSVLRDVREHQETERILKYGHARDTGNNGCKTKTSKAKNPTRKIKIKMSRIKIDLHEISA